MAGRKAPGANSSARTTKDNAGIPEAGKPGRGSSVHGPLQDAKGGRQGANQGGASRGGSRVEPSQAHDIHRKDRALRPKRRGD
jgi:hypothetical protein